MFKNLAIGMVALGALLWVSVAEAQPVHTAADCQSRIRNFNKRARCMACVRKGGVFKKQGRRAGFCQHRRAPAPPPPAPPPPVARPHRDPGIVSTAPGCNARIARPHKRQRCHRCVRAGGTFLKHAGRGHGFCRFPSSRTWVVADTIRTQGGCRTRIRRPGKRARCVSCVNYGGIFQKEGAGHGFCRGAAAPPPPPPRPHGTVHSAAGCRSRIVRPGKRARCIACTNNGGVFHKQGGGGGFCQGGRANAFLRTAIECSNRIGRLGKRNRCIACVNQGRTFETQGAGHGFCRGRVAPPPPVRHDTVHSAAGCRTRIARPGKRARCVSCVNRGGVFQKQGAGAGFCRGGRPAVHHGAAIRTIGGCRSRIARPRKKGRCIACVRGGRVFYRQGNGHGVCR